MSIHSFPLTVPLWSYRTFSGIETGIISLIYPKSYHDKFLSISISFTKFSLMLLQKMKIFRTFVGPHYWPSLGFSNTLVMLKTGDYVLIIQIQDKCVKQKQWFTLLLSVHLEGPELQTLPEDVKSLREKFLEVTFTKTRTHTFVNKNWRSWRARFAP